MDEQLELELTRALARNRRLIVSRALDHCGYRVDNSDNPPTESTATCRELEEHLLQQGLARHRGLSLRRLWARLTGRTQGHCPTRRCFAFWRLRFPRDKIN